MTQILDGKKIADEICRDLTELVRDCARPPHLIVILVGDDPASKIYIQRKERMATRIGITTDIVRLPETTTEDALLSFIGDLDIGGAPSDAILVQLPLPLHIRPDVIFQAIDPDKDVDGFHPLNVGRFYNGDQSRAPCTPEAIMRLLDAAEPSLKGALALVIGTGAVGRPTALMLSQAGATVTMANSRTRDIPDFCFHADIIVAAAGHPNLVKGDYLWKQSETIIIDVGINRLADGRIVGDVAFDECVGIARAITPVPGGVGPMTVACLMKNTLDCYSRILKRNI